MTNVNDLPVASDFTKTTDEDTALTFAAADFTSAFSDPDGHDLQSVKLETLPASTHGTLKVGTSDATANQVVPKASLGTISFVPAANWNGSASFTYKAIDSSAEESAAAAKVTVTVTAVNDLPVASAIEKTTDEDTALTFAATDFTDSFDDPDSHALKSVKLVTLPASAQGTLKVGASDATANQVVLAASLNTISFMPAANWSGSASFTYKAMDTSGEESAEAATVTVTVSAVNDAPGGSVTIGGTATQGRQLTANTSAITDADGLGTFSYQWNRISDGTTTAISGATASTYTLVQADVGATIEVTVSWTDLGGTSESLTSDATAAVTNANDAPGGSVTITGTATQGEELTADTSAITDADGLGAFSYQWKRDIDDTVTAISGATSSTYTLVQADVGATITVTVSWTDLGGTAESLTSDATAAVANANDAPGGTVTITGTTTQGQQLTADTSAITDADGLGTFSYQWKRTVDETTTAISDATASTYTLVQADVGAKITVTVSWTDEGGTSESLTSAATAAVANVNDLPVASAIEKTTDEDTALTFAASDFTDAFSDPDGHTLQSVKLVTLPVSAQGTLKVGTSDATENQVVLATSLNTISFMPAANYSGSASFTYKATDSSGEESAAAAKVTVTVSAVNDRPVASAIEKTTDEDTALTFAASDFTGVFSDPDSHALKSVKLVTLPASSKGTLKVGTSDATVNQEVLAASLNTISFEPAANWSGSASFTYKVTDTSDEESAEAATVTVTVSAVNDAPGGSVTIGGLHRDAGPAADREHERGDGCRRAGNVLLPVEADHRQHDHGHQRGHGLDLHACAGGRGRDDHGDGVLDRPGWDSGEPDLGRHGGGDERQRRSGRLGDDRRNRHAGRGTDG